MKKLKLILIALITITFISCNCTQKKDTAVVEIISMEDLQNAGASIQLVDVRTPEEYSEGYILNAKNVNFNADNFMELMSEFDKDEPVYVYCMVGGRSGKSAAALKEAGFTKIFDYKGGYKEWTAEGKPITQNK